MSKRYPKSFPFLDLDGNEFTLMIRKPTRQEEKLLDDEAFSEGGVYRASEAREAFVDKILIGAENYIDDDGNLVSVDDPDWKTKIDYRYKKAISLKFEVVQRVTKGQEKN